MNVVKGDGLPLDMQQRIAAHRSGVVAPSKQTGQAAGSQQTAKSTDTPAFSQILSSKLESEVKFSSHASTRLKSRNIDITPEIMGKLEKAVSGAANKGAKDSLILMKDLAFIVNIPNRTVITAMDGESLKQNVFTNIDSAVIAD
jgi:flagellar operon protein